MEAPVRCIIRDGCRNRDATGQYGGVLVMRLLHDSNYLKYIEKTFNYTTDKVSWLLGEEHKGCSMDWADVKTVQYRQVRTGFGERFLEMLYNDLFR